MGNMLIIGILLVLTYIAGYSFGWRNGHEAGHLCEEESYGGPDE